LLDVSAINTASGVPSDRTNLKHTGRRWAPSRAGSTSSDPPATAGNSTAIIALGRYQRASRSEPTFVIARPRRSQRVYENYDRPACFAVTSDPAGQFVRVHASTPTISTPAMIVTTRDRMVCGVTIDAARGLPAIGCASRFTERAALATQIAKRDAQPLSGRVGGDRRTPIITPN
jgi:hypothetical protein